MTDDAAPSERLVYLRGVDVFVRERGVGRPLLLINGLGANVEMWGPAEERLSAVARTIAFDAPGCGRSPAVSRPMTIGWLTELVSETLDALGYDRVDVLGFSLGGLVAQQLAHDRPERVDRIALVATACGWGSMPGSLDALTLIALPIRYHSRVLYEQTKWLLAPADRELVDRVHALTEARLRRPPSLVAYTAQLCAGALWSSLRWLPSVETPTLIVHGAGDRLVPPANAVQLARLLPHSRLQVLPDEGHLLVFDPASGSIPLLEDYFAAESPEASRAWATGTAVEDDEAVEQAFSESCGAEPYRALSRAYRRFVHRAA
jgi:pimeloyl-ACP methyl ester carboxylesterase